MATVNVFNPTDKEVWDHVNGLLVRVPPMGQTEVTERKAAVLLKLHPELSLGPCGKYSQEEIALMEKMDLVELQEFTALLMKGLKPPVEGKKVSKAAAAIAEGPMGSAVKKVVSEKKAAVA